MRQIGTLASANDAQRFQDYLLTIGVKSQTESQGQAWAVWVYDEDKIDAARQALAQFVDDPGDRRFAVGEAAAEIRREQIVKEKAARKSVVDVRKQWDRPLASRRPITVALIAVSIFVAVGSKVGEEYDPFLKNLSITAHEQRVFLKEVRGGEMWRLVTPIFIHFGLLHILFNMLWLRDLGAEIEARRGSGRYLLLVLFVAIVSNLSQYVVSGPRFGGMSGVVFGLFGYVWMKGRFDPSSGFYMSATNVFLMIAWLVICYSGGAGPIANTAHTVGLACGVVAAITPIVWRRLTGG
jgi:GlpG protein